MKRRVDDAGRDGVESNMLFRVFQSQTSHRRVQTAFRDHGKRSSYASNWIVNQRRSDAHDAAARLLRLHLFHRQLRDVNETEKVSRYERAKIVRRIISELLHHKDTGIRDHGIDRAELLEGEFCNFMRCFNLPYVAVDQREMVGS